MKRLFTFVAVILMFAGSGNASAKAGKKSVVSSKQDVDRIDSFKLESGYEMLTLPLVAEINVDSERREFTGFGRKDKPASLSSREYLLEQVDSSTKWGDAVLTQRIEILKARVMYDFCQEYDADLIVAPQYKSYIKTHTVKTTDDEGNPIEVEEPVIYDNQWVVVVELKGYPASYYNFRSGSFEDRWIKDLFKMGRISNESEVLTENTSKEVKTDK